MSQWEDQAVDELADEEGYNRETETTKTDIQQTKERDDTQSRVIGWSNPPPWDAANNVNFFHNPKESRLNRSSSHPLEGLQGKPTVGAGLPINYTIEPL